MPDPVIIIGAGAAGLATARERPDPFSGSRVLVVGVGNSGGEIASELARAGVDVSVAVRSGANVVPLTLAGVPIQYLATQVGKPPRSAHETVVRAVRRISERRRGPPVLPVPPHSALDGFRSSASTSSMRSGQVACTCAPASIRSRPVECASPTARRPISTLSFLRPVSGPHSRLR